LYNLSVDPSGRAV